VEQYANVTSGWSKTDQVDEEFYPNGVRQVTTGYTPDALIPYYVLKKKGENKVGVNLNQGIFLETKIPATAPAGTYTGTVIINIEGEGAMTLPVKMTVYGFRLPEENHSKTVIAVDPNEFNDLYGTTYSNNLFSDYYGDAIDYLADYNISSGALRGSCWSTNEVNNYIEEAKKATMDPRIPAYFLRCNYVTGVKAKVRYKETSSSYTYTTKSVTNMCLYRIDDYNYNDDPNTPVYGMKSLLKIFTDASTNECNLLKKALFYFPQNDEPWTFGGFVPNIINYNTLQEGIQYALAKCNLTGKDEVRESLINLQYMVTSNPSDEFLNCLNGNVTFSSIQMKNDSGTYVDVSNTGTILDYHTSTPLTYNQINDYCPRFKWCSDVSSCWDTIQEYLADGEHNIWWYGCVDPVGPYASLDLGNPMQVERVNKWLEFILGIEGEFYYMCNRTHSYDGTNTWALTEEEILAGLAVYESSWGDGLLIYPVYNMYKDFGLSYIPSMRLMNLSESIDDYNYLWYAQSLIDQLTSDKEVYQQQLFDIVSSITTNAYSNSTDPVALATAKDNLAQLIVTLLDILG